MYLRLLIEYVIDEALNDARFSHVLVAEEYDLMLHACAQVAIDRRSYNYFRHGENIF